MTFFSCFVQGWDFIIPSMGMMLGIAVPVFMAMGLVVSVIFWGVYALEKLSK